MQHIIPYDMSHFPVSVLDIEFLLAGLDGLVEDYISPIDDDLSETDYNEENSNAEEGR